MFCGTIADMVLVMQLCRMKPELSMLSRGEVGDPDQLVQKSYLVVFLGRTASKKRVTTGVCAGALP
jgi:hypothetical protein